MVATLLRDGFRADLESSLAESDEDRGFSFDLGPTPTPLPTRKLGSEGEPKLDHFDIDPGEPQPEPAHPAATLRVAVPDAATATPAIKRIQFPMPAHDTVPSKAATPRSAATPSRAAPSEAPAPSPAFTRRAPHARTHFSPSVGTTRPRSDSVDELAPPEDLPESDSPLLPAAGCWAPETPTIGALWQKARASLADSRTGALDWSRRSSVAGRRLAEEFRRSLRERRAAALTERQAALSGVPRATAGPSSTTAPSVEAPVHQTASAASSGSALRTTLRAALPQPPRLRPVARRLAAPIATVGLAALVYVGGGKLLGTVELPALSRSNEGAPDLGTLPTKEFAASEREKPTKTADRQGRSPANPSAKRPAAATPSGPAPPAIETLPMPTGLDYPGKGLIEVVTAEDELIYVNGVFIGRGPLRRVPVNPGEHAISIRNGSGERKGLLTIEAGRCSRASFVPPP